MAILIANKGLNGRLKISGNSTGGFKARYVIPPTDADAQAFFNRVTVAGGTLSATERTAVNNFVISLKAASLWTKLIALYPMVGASAFACAQNLKSSSYTSTFNGAWTFASTGVTGNGTSTYANTGLNLATNTTLYNVHYSIYCRNNTNAGIDMGVADSRGNVKEGWIAARIANVAYANFYDHEAVVGTQGWIAVANANSQGLFISSAVASNNIFFTKNNISIGTFTGSNTSLPADGSIYFGAINNVVTSVASEFTAREYALVSIGDGLTTTQASDFYTAVQLFQIALSRNV